MASNIKSGVNIFGVTGTYTGESSSSGNEVYLIDLGDRPLTYSSSSGSSAIMRISYPSLPSSPTGEWLAVGWAFVIDLRYASGSNDWLFFDCGMNFGDSIVIIG